jgi:hypothetical protein
MSKQLYEAAITRSDLELWVHRLEQRVAALEARLAERSGSPGGGASGQPAR